MIVVNAVIHSKREDIAALKNIISTMETASRAEPGCDDYTFSVELNNTNILRITEKWHTVDDLKAHFGMPHMDDFQKALAEYAPSSLEVKF
ncbi:MAG: putative quinol monooxygenase [Halioglobus sp.]